MRLHDHVYRMHRVNNTRTQQKERERAHILHAKRTSDRWEGWWVTYLFSWGREIRYCGGAHWMPGGLVHFPCLLHCTGCMLRCRHHIRNSDLESRPAVMYQIIDYIGCDDLRCTLGRKRKEYWLIGLVVDYYFILENLFSSYKRPNKWTVNTRNLTIFNYFLYATYSTYIQYISVCTIECVFWI